MSKRKIRPLTPGPWNWRELNPKDKKWELCEVWTVDDYGDGFGKLICSGGLGIANAQLIAAAPELLEALKGVLTVADRKTKEFDLAWAAIAKAEGRS